jgi:hypothetical protein
MNIRGLMDQNQNLVAVVAVVVMILALIYIFYSCQGPRRYSGTSEAYYYDVVTEKVFTDEANLIAPIKSPDGNEAVRVHFYSCGSCSKSERFAGYYEKYPPEAKAKIEELMKSEHGMEMMYEYENTPLVSLDAKTWVQQSSQEGAGIQEELDKKLTCEGNKRPRYCLPD